MAMTQAPQRPFDRRRFLHATAALAGAGALAPSAWGQAGKAPATAKLANKVQMKFATITAESFPYVDGARKWKELLEARTGGMVELQIFHSAQLGNERTINEGVLAGSIQAGVGAGAWAGFVPQYNVVSLPFLVRDLKHMYAIADGAPGEQIARDAEAKGFKVMAYYSAGDQHFQTRSKPVRSIDDFKGLKIRVIENKALIDSFRAMGAVPAPLPYPQIYTALQQGTVDGSANDILSVTTLKMYEVAKFLTLSSYVCEPRPLIMSKAFFDSQPPDLQRVLLETARESAVYERKVFEEKLVAGEAELKKNGMTVLTLTDRDKWVERVKPVWDEFAKSTPGGAELMKAIQAL
jgi:tripartite ATP-independent transporter DctP family solute receptor